MASATAVSDLPICGLKRTLSNYQYFYYIHLLNENSRGQICIQTGRILQTRNRICWNGTKKGTADAFFRKSISTFSIRLTGALFKSQVVVAYNSPGRFLLLIRWKILVILRFAFVDREVHKFLNYQPKFSQMERPLVNVL